MLRLRTPPRTAASRSATDAEHRTAGAASHKRNHGLRVISSLHLPAGGSPARNGCQRAHIRGPWAVAGRYAAARGGPACLQGR